MLEAWEGYLRATLSGLAITSRLRTREGQATPNEPWTDLTDDVSPSGTWQRAAQPSAPHRDRVIMIGCARVPLRVAQEGGRGIRGSEEVAARDHPAPRTPHERARAVPEEGGRDSTE